jgi:hypothetical protein
LDINQQFAGLGVDRIGDATYGREEFRSIQLLAKEDRVTVAVSPHATLLQKLPKRRRTTAHLSPFRPPKDGDGPVEFRAIPAHAVRRLKSFSHR